MKAIGFLAIVLGGLIVYLGYQGKVGAAWDAVKTGG